MYGQAGQLKQALATVAKALAVADSNSETWCNSELQRLRGNFLLQQDRNNMARADRSFRNALQVARAQQAKALELRAATSLARLWAEQGERRKAHDLLAPIYSWFTEGFDTADLNDAKALLDELA